jgi:hypothetical protein
VAVEGLPGPDLVLVQARLPLSLLVAFFGTPAAAAPVIIVVPSAGLVANSVSSGTCTCSRRCLSWHHCLGRYSRKSNSVCPRAVT